MKIAPADWNPEPPGQEIGWNYFFIWDTLYETISVYYFKMFMKVVSTMELKKSTNKLPTNGTMKNARGAGP